MLKSKKRWCSVFNSELQVYCSCVLRDESLHQWHISEAKKLAAGLTKRPKTVTTCIRSENGGKKREEEEEEEEERGRPNHFPC